MGDYGSAIGGAIGTVMVLDVLEKATKRVNKKYKKKENKKHPYKKTRKMKGGKK